MHSILLVFQQKKDKIYNFFLDRIMAQTFIKNIEQRNQRVFMIHGKSIPYILNKMPNVRDNFLRVAMQPISKHDQWIAEQVGPV